MKFLEKDLETIIWENYEACEAKGLYINQDLYESGQCYRQLNLGPYGIADLIYLRYIAHVNTYFVQIIELKKGKIDMAAYGQVCRYMTAIKRLIESAHAFHKSPVEQANIKIEAVLIGDDIERSGDFTFVLNQADNCQCYTYSYGFSGLKFHEHGEGWHLGKDAESPAFQRASNEFYRHELIARNDYAESQDEQGREYARAAAELEEQEQERRYREELGEYPEDEDDYQDDYR